jgi:glycosyltransferase involved in cell wall biosynthesis
MVQGETFTRIAVSLGPGQPIHVHSLWGATRRDWRSAPIGSVGDYFDNALAQTVKGNYKAELVRGPDHPGPWKTVEELELLLLTKDQARRSRVTNSLGVLIVVYTYNHEGFIAQCLESVLAQHKKYDFLVRVHDDQSDDDTFRIVCDYAANQPDVFSVSQSVEKSFPELPVIEDERGYEYVAYLDGDDFWTDDAKITKQVEFMESHPEISISHHKSVEMQDGAILEDFENQRHIPRTQSAGVLRRGLSMTRSSVMRRAFPVEHAGYRGRILNYDEFIRTQASLYGGVGYVEEILPVVHRLHGQNAWAGRDSDDQVIAQATSYFFIAKWLRSKGLFEDSRFYLTVAGGLMLGPDPALHVAVKRFGIVARIERILYRFKVALESLIRGESAQEKVGDSR